MQVLLVNSANQGLPKGTTELLRDIGWTFTTASDFHQAIARTRENGIDAVIMCEPHPAAPGDTSHNDFHTFVRLLDAKRIAAVMLTPRPSGASLTGGGDTRREITSPAAGRERSLREQHTLIDVVGRDIPLAELRGRLAMIERYHSLLQRLEQELRNMERLSKRLNEHFYEVDQEMRLAGRLQRDFLPDLRKPFGNLKFGSVYRPASWVSGDMFDVFRIDEDHTGVYLADAVGHGMAASLLTMFIKRAIIPKRVDGDQYAVLGPSEIMRALNDALADQALPNCQFVTACYALINHRTLKFQYARGGHPYPLLITTGGAVSELKSSGGLLGLFKGEEFTTFETQLEPGDKLLFYTDGVELCFQGQDAPTFDAQAYHGFFESVADQAIDRIMRQVEMRLDREPGSLNPRDDITVLGFEVLGGAQQGALVAAGFAETQP
jgi:sigma-B regulation protein RsbU (phosphoserine phosphatase)